MRVVCGASRFGNCRHKDPNYVPTRSHKAYHIFSSSEREVLEQCFNNHGAKIPSIDERAKLATQLGVEPEAIYNWFVSIQLINGGMLIMGPQVCTSLPKEQKSRLGAPPSSLQ